MAQKQYKQDTWIQVWAETALILVTKEFSLI